MSTVEIAYQGGGDFKFVKWLLVVGLLLAAVAYTGHAIKQHGGEAAAIRQCMENGGPRMTYVSRSPNRSNTFYMGCQLPDGRWGLQILENTKNGWREKTSFIVKSGQLTEWIEYVSARAIPWAP